MILEVADKLRPPAILVCGQPVEDLVLIIRALTDAQHQVLTILRQLQPETPIRMIGPFINKLVLRLWCAQFVKIYLLVDGTPLELLALFGLGKSAVVKSRTVFQPRHAGPAKPLKRLVQVLVVFDFQDPQFLPIGSSFADGVRNEFSIIADRGRRKGDRSVF